MSCPFRMRHISVAYDRKLVVEDVNLDIPAGTLMAIVGPNGAGKSSLIKAALDLVPKVSGACEAFGRPFRPGDPRIGYVPQRETVDWDFPVSVWDVTLMGTYGGLRWYRRPGATERERATVALDAVGMSDFANRQISQLSGGQQQRVFLARALAQEASIYFMDEPLTGVDAATEQAVIGVLTSLKHQGRTVVAVHHDLDTVPEYFDEVALLNRRLIAVGDVDSTFTPENLRLAYGGRLRHAC